jgi:hypothetical protein
MAAIAAVMRKLLIIINNVCKLFYFNPAFISLNSAFLQGDTRMQKLCRVYLMPQDSFLERMSEKKLKKMKNICKNLI